MQKTKNKKQNNGSHWGDMAKSLAEGFIKKVSFDVVVGIKEQWDKFIFKAKSGMVAIIFSVVGLVFIMIGLAIFLNSFFMEIPGAGFMMVGLVLALIGWMANLIKKMI